jgi:hypothetical protein
MEDIRQTLEYQNNVKGFVNREVRLCVSIIVLELMCKIEYFPEWETELCNLVVKRDEDGSVREVYEYWAVSSFLADDLTAKGEVVEELMDLYIWGRTCTGQSISTDTVIQDIYDDLGK